MHPIPFALAGLLRRTALAAGLLAAPLHPAWAVVKCVAADGHVTFQDVGCDVQSTSHPLVKRFGQLSSEEPAPRAPRTTRGQPEALAVHRATPTPGGHGAANTPAWR